MDTIKIRPEPNKINELVNLYNEYKEATQNHLDYAQRVKNGETELEHHFQLSLLMEMLHALEEFKHFLSNLEDSIFDIE